MGLRTSVAALSAIGLLSAAHPTAERPRECATDRFDHMTKGDATIVMRSGRAFALLGQDFIDPKAWRRGQRVVICRDDPKATPASWRVEIFGIRNSDRGETLFGSRPLGGEPSRPR
jgi:hypothetical protein